MLSKEKITKKADMYAEYHWPATIYAGEELKKQFCNQNFTAGATWASEQYAGVVGILYTIQMQFKSGCGIDQNMFSALNNSIERELNKLKQP